MQYKNLSKALERVNQVYLTGTIEFYAKMENDPWAEAHQELDFAISMAPHGDGYFDVVVPAISTFTHTIEKLIEQYRPFSKKSRSSPQVTGFYSNSEEQSDARFSTQERRCAECTTDKGIKVRRHPKSGTSVIMCETCFQTGAQR